MAEKFELLEAGDYYGALLKEMPRAKKRIVLAAMALLWGERTAPVFDILKEAAGRGVKVTVLLDNFTRMTYLLGLESKQLPGKERLNRTFRALEDLSAEGATVHCFGKLGIVPYKGRCHIKATVIDDTCFSFGGVNFYDEMFGAADYMLKRKDPELASHLEKLVKTIIQTRPPLADQEIRLDAKTHILIDGGRPKSSLIYERACELASQSKKVYFMSQMVPSGQLARLLHETKAVIYTNRPEQMQSIAGIGQAYDQQKFRLSNQYRGGKFIHAKFILFELASGKKALLSGSHNFSYRGVNFGTQEICLHSADTRLWHQLYRFMEETGGATASAASKILSKKSQQTRRAK